MRRQPWPAPRPSSWRRSTSMASAPACRTCWHGWNASSRTSSRCRNSRRWILPFPRVNLSVRDTGRCGRASDHGTASRCWAATPCRSRAAGACRAIPATARAATWKRRSMASSWPACTCPMAIRNRGRSSTTNSSGCSACASTQAAWSGCRIPSPCWAISTWCPPTRTSTTPRAGAATRCCSRRCATSTRACSNRVGPTASEQRTATRASTRSGTTSASTPNAIGGCASTTCC